MILSDIEIARLAITTGMITPFHRDCIREVDDRRVLSYGSAPFGYDTTLNEEVMVFSNLNTNVIDVKRPSGGSLVRATVHNQDGERYVILPPHSYMLGRTNETIWMPRDVTALVVGKSSYARVGLIVNTTVVWAGFRGTVVLEAANTANLPSKVYLDEGFATLLFFRGESAARSLYDGVYQDQAGVKQASV